MGVRGFVISMALGAALLAGFAAGFLLFLRP